MERRGEEQGKERWGEDRVEKGRGTRGEGEESGEEPVWRGIKERSGGRRGRGDLSTCTLHEDRVMDMGRGGGRRLNSQQYAFLHNFLHCILSRLNTVQIAFC